MGACISNIDIMDNKNTAWVENSWSHMMMMASQIQNNTFNNNIAEHFIQRTTQTSLR